MKRPPVASENLTAINWKRNKIGGKLVLITNMKSYMGFPLVPKSVTLNDPEWHNGHYSAYVAEFGGFHGQLLKSG